MFDLFAFIGILIVIVIVITSYWRYKQMYTPRNKEERNSAPYHYKTGKQQTYSPQNCDKIVTNTTKKS